MFNWYYLVIAALSGAAMALQAHLMLPWVKFWECGNQL